MSTMPLAVVLLTDVGGVSIAVQHEVVNLMLYHFGLIKKNDLIILSLSVDFLLHLFYYVLHLRTS